MGPFKKSSIQSWYYRGFLPGETLVCHEGKQEWVPLTSIPKLDELPKLVTNKIEKAQTPQPWWNDPATERQLVRLRGFEIPFGDGPLTKKQASSLIEFFIEVDPQREEAYQNQPATPDQAKALEDLGATATNLTRREARAQIEELTSYDTELEMLGDMVNDAEWLRQHGYAPIKRVQLAEMRDILEKKNLDWMGGDGPSMREGTMLNKIVRLCPDYFTKAV